MIRSNTSARPRQRRYPNDAQRRRAYRLEIAIRAMERATRPGRARR